MSEDQEVYSYDNILVNTSLRKVFVNNVPIKLGRVDYNILLLLMQNVNRCVSRDEIFDGVWEYSHSCRTLSDEKLLNAHISIIRTRIKQVDENAAKCIITEKCYGYRIGQDFYG
ncbi:MAG: winged helix-turn-helix domain-containing protein [Candidatus Ancillula trichonymphae]|nr:winged helix-turn-helix domain-containing protein [Candidatus Ancillula trichonymphae]